MLESESESESLKVESPRVCQLLSELESVAAVPAEMKSEQEDLHEERIFLVAEVNINDLF